MEHAPDIKKFLNPVAVFIFVFAFGILFSSFREVAPLVCVFILLLGLAVGVSEKIYSGSVKEEVFLIFLVLISFGLGSLRYAIKDFHEIDVPAERGVVVSEPEDKDNVRRFIILSDNGEKVLVSAPLYTEIEYGDAVIVTGKLERPGIIEDDEGGRPFNYGEYLAKDDIYHTLSFADVEIVSSGNGNPLKSWLFKIKRSFADQAKSLFSEPYASLLLGLLVAGRDAMPEDILEEFRRAGVIHIVVLSGFNITLIAEFMRRLFQGAFLLVGFTKFPKSAAGASVVGIVLFVIMTGAEATVVRASLMALTVVLAGLFGRKYSASRALVMAGFLMLLENPKILVFDPSFQLSFLATLGLIYVMTPIGKSLRFITERWNIRETLAQTLSTQLAVLPLLTYSMGDVSLVSLPANMLILLIVPWTMFLGFVSVMISYLGFIVAWPFALVTHLMLSWILFVSHALGSLSFATIDIPNVHIAFVLLAYGILIIYLGWQKKGGHLWSNRRFLR